MFNRWLWLCLLMCTGPLSASTPQGDFNKANEAYIDGKYAEAAAIYDSLIKNQGASSDLYYNLGNAFARSGDAGQAVLAYERGLVLNPRDAELKANLEKVRQRHHLFEAAAPVWQQPFFMLSQKAWAGIVLTLAWLAALAFSSAIFLRGRVKKGLVKGLVIGGVLFSLLLLPGLMAAWLFSRTSDRVVVIVPNTALLISPFAGSASATVLKAGETVSGRESHGAYLYVKNDEGKEGWVQSQNVEKILR